MKKKETKACKVKSGMLKVRKEKIFPNFFFDFLVQNDSIRKKKHKSEECGGFRPF